MHHHHARIEDRADVLRRRISLYRVYLINGVNAPRAHAYVREIADAEAELAEIESQATREAATA